MQKFNPDAMRPYYVPDAMKTNAKEDLLPNAKEDLLPNTREEDTVFYKRCTRALLYLGEHGLNEKDKSDNTKKYKVCRFFYEEAKAYMFEIYDWRFHMEQPPYPVYFEDVLSLRLAINIAPALSGESDIRMILQLYEKTLAEAKHTDAKKSYRSVSYNNDTIDS